MTTNQGIIASLQATATITKDRFVRADGVLATANQRAIGVSNDDAIATEFFPVVMTGITLVEAGAAVAVNDQVASDATGRAVTVTSTNPVNGIALDAASGAGKFIRIKVI